MVEPYALSLEMAQSLASARGRIPPWENSFEPLSESPKVIKSCGPLLIPYPSKMMRPLGGEGL